MSECRRTPRIRTTSCVEPVEGAEPAERDDERPSLGGASRAVEGPDPDHGRKPVDSTARAGPASTEGAESSGADGSPTASKALAGTSSPRARARTRPAAHGRAVQPGSRVRSAGAPRARPRPRAPMDDDTEGEEARPERGCDGETAALAHRLSVNEGSLCATTIRLSVTSQRRRRASDPRPAVGPLACPMPDAGSLIDDAPRFRRATLRPSCSCVTPTTGSRSACCRRHLDSDFVGGAFVFPGGKVDEDDRSELAQTVCAGRSDEQASELLGVESGRPRLLRGRAAGVLRGSRDPARLPGRRDRRRLSTGRRTMRPSRGSPGSGSR